MGVLNTDPAVSLNATMLQHQPTPGNIAFITQSGALGAALLDYAENLGMGFSKIASLGNQMDIDAGDLLGQLRKDDQTKVVLLYLENIGDGSQFLRQVSELTKTKPVIVVKSGRSLAGAAAASSHTGSLTGSDVAVEALIGKAGAIRVDTLEMGFLTAMALSKMKTFSGNRIGVVTNAGGPGILITDRLSLNGFDMPLLPANDRKTLAAELYPEASTGNPVDIIAPAPPEHYAKALDAMAKSGQYDALAVICVPPATIDTGKIAEALIPVIQSYDLPVICCFVGPTLGGAARRVLNLNQLPCLDFPESVADVLNHMKIRADFNRDIIYGDASKDCTRYDAARRKEARLLMNEVHSTGYMKSDAALKLLKLYGITTPNWYWFTKTDQVRSSILNFPVVAKIEHPEVIHKSDAGGVILNIACLDELEEVVRELLSKFPGATAVLVQEQVKVSHELILGGKFEPSIGHLCLVGAGGTLVEIFKDVTVSLIPVGKREARNMLEQLKSYPLFNGYRGKPKMPLDDVSEMIEAFSNMIQALPSIIEIDLNPITWDQTSNKLLALDCRIKVD